MSVKRSTPRLDGITSWVREIGATYRVHVEPDTPETAHKLAWLKKGGRDFLQETPALQQAVARYLKANVARVLTSGGNLRTAETLQVAGDAIKAHVLLRFAHGGNDVTLAALSPAYAAYKRAAGLDPRIGVATKLLLDAIRASRFVLRKG